MRPIQLLEHAVRAHSSAFVRARHPDEIILAIGDAIGSGLVQHTDDATLLAAPAPSTRRPAPPAGRERIW
jgi:hypothetical protein